MRLTKPCEQQAADNQIGNAGNQDPADPACRAPPDPAAEQLRGPAVQAAKAAPNQQQDAEDQRRDKGRGHDQGDAVIRHPHQLADLILPVLPEPEGSNEQDPCADEEGAPGPGPRTPGIPVGESTPNPRGEYSEPVADGCGDATDQALDDTAPREQRRRERKTGENERTPAAGKCDIKQLPAFRGLSRSLRASSRSYGRRCLDGHGRLAAGGCPARPCTLTRRIWLLTP